MRHYVDDPSDNMCLTYGREFDLPNYHDDDKSNDQSSSNNK